ncbi:hypothetical protein BH09PSE2_BH09PSE2_16700 [soil metagenome]
MQTDTGDIFAGQTLHVEEASDGGASSSAVAIGNEYSAKGSSQAINVTSHQTLAANVTARAEGAVDSYAGPILSVTSSATGNSGTVSTCCAAGTGTATQTVTPYHEISAQTFASTTSADQISADSTALGNTHGWLATNGYSNSTTVQSMQGAVTATTETSACCVGYLVGASATAVSNNVTVDVTGGAADAVVDQHVDGFGTTATVLVNQGSADTAAAVATSTANNVSMTVDGGAASLSNAQVNESPVNATATLNVDTFDSVASTSAYGVGNSAIVTEVGPGAAIFNSQTNNGAITATANTNGGSGYEGIAQASAIGNAISTYVCASCNGGVQADNSQANAGAVRAYSTVTIGPAGVIAGQASAVGNHAAFVVKTPGS